MQKISFSLPGVYAIDPKAFGVEVIYNAFLNSGVRYECAGSVAVVEVHGPISYSHPLCATYSSVLERVKVALASDAHTVVLRLASPGGDVHGALDTSRAIRSAARAAGKRVIGYSDAQACSSAYALLCASDEVSVSSTGTLGSIGVIMTLGSLLAAEKSEGLKFALVTSGKRKADGNPHAPLTGDVLEAAQVQVDALAAEFFRLVADHRGIDAAPLEAATFVGSAAVDLKLADRVESYEELLARVAVAPVVATPSLSLQSAAVPQGKYTMPDDEKDDKTDAVRASLVSAAASDDPEKSARAKRALAAYDARAEAGDEDEKKEGAKKAKAASELATSLAAQVQALSGELASFKAERVQVERAAFFASRPDLAPELVATFAALPLDQIKAIVAEIKPGVSRTVTNPLAATPSVTPGEGQNGESVSRLSAEDSARLDIAMGLGRTEQVIENLPHKIVFRTVVKGAQ